jgi:hypothetical protein
MEPLTQSYGRLLYIFQIIYIGIHPKHMNLLKVS